MSVETRRNYFLLHLNLFIWGFTAIIGLFIAVSPLVLVVYRTFLATLGLGLIFLFQQKKITFSKAYLPLLYTGALVCLHWLAFFGSARLSTASISLVCLSTQALFTSFLDPFINKKPLIWTQVWVGLLVVVGLAFIFHFEFQYVWGILAGLCSAFLGTIFGIYNARFVEKFDASIITFYEMVGACLTAIFITFFYIFIAKPLDFQVIPSSNDWFWLLILAWVCTVYPFTQWIRLTKHFSAYLLSLNLNLEPVYGIIMAFLIFGNKERMTFGFYLGTFIILGAVVGYSTLMKQK